MLHHSDCVMLWQILHRSVRLPHSPSLVAIGLSVGYETWPPILWLVYLNIDWDCLVPQCIMGSRGHWEFPLFFRPQWQSICTALTPGSCLPCNRTVEESTVGLTAAGKCIKWSAKIFFFYYRKTRNLKRIMYVLAWRTVYALTRGLFWCLFPELRSNEGNKHQNNTRVNA